MISLLAFFGLAINMQMQAQTLSIADVEALPGETVAFGLTVDVQGGLYSGFQFKMQFPATGFTLKGTTVDATIWDGASFSVGDLASGVANGAAFSSSDTTIPDGEVLIGTVKFMVDPNVQYGDYDVTISNFDFLDGTNYTPVDDVTFKVHVVAIHTVVLDELSTEMPQAATGVNVLVKRTINAKEWSTICLPFAMSEAQVQAAFNNEEVQLLGLAKFKGWNVTEYDDNDNATSIKVTFEDVDAIAANTPYIIKVSKAMTEFTVDDVDIDPEDEPSVSVGKMNRGTFGSFTGTYVPIYVEEENLFLSENKFWYSTGNTKMKGFRGYFFFQEVLADYYDAGARILISFDDESTGIHENRRGGDDRYYDLKGMRVEKPSKKGIYINNGKTKVVK